MSLQLSQDHSLQHLNTFGVSVKANWYAEAADEAEVREALAAASQLQLPLLVLGGGSNLLLTRDVEALVLRMTGQGRRIVSDDGVQVVVEAEAGEPWHPFVQWTLQQGLGGLENLSLIPGTVGAAPVQNVGAYGVETGDVLHSLLALHRPSGELREMTAADCQFAYRDSLFKREARSWVILRVRFALSRQPQLKLDYGPVRQQLASMGVEQPTAQDVSRAVCATRSEKLPDPALLGNAGSFFKNPLVSQQQAEALRQQYPDLVCYPAGEQVKLAAGQLIDKAGWKGHRAGDAGVHALQALVLVNYGRASGSELLALARRIQADIRERFGVELEIEPLVY